MPRVLVKDCLKAPLVASDERKATHLRLTQAWSTSMCLKRADIIRDVEFVLSVTSNETLACFHQRVDPLYLRLTWVSLRLGSKPSGTLIPFAGVFWWVLWPEKSLSLAAIADGTR